MANRTHGIIAVTAAVIGLAAVLVAGSGVAAAAAAGQGLNFGAIVDQAPADHHGGGMGHGHGMMAGMAPGGGHGMGIAGMDWQGFGAMSGAMSGVCDEVMDAFMDQPDFHEHMMQMMFSGEVPSVEECEAWMDEAGVPEDLQEECLEHMTEMSSYMQLGPWQAATP